MVHHYSTLSLASGVSWSTDHCLFLIEVMLPSVEIPPPGVSEETNLEATPQECGDWSMFRKPDIQRGKCIEFMHSTHSLNTPTIFIPTLSFSLCFGKRVSASSLSRKFFYVKMSKSEYTLYVCTITLHPPIKLLVVALALMVDLM